MNVLPKIEGDVDILLDIYSHQSLRGDSPLNDEYGDIDRLVELGSKALDMAVTAHFFQKRPMLIAPQMNDEVKSAVSDEKLRDWLAASNIQSRYRAAPGVVSILESPVDMRRFFCSYIGALYIRNGFHQVQAWISALIDPNAHVDSFGTLLPPPQPLGMPPPLPNPSTSPQNSGNILSVINEAAMKRGVSVTYPAEQTGPPHAPTWTVTCVVGGIEKGRGSGKGTKAAKEAAARQAMQNLGW
ncbi:hypothetical protein DFH07DRAFT_851555 [Mycena maculata]|uniref:Uncharacterized protein n=1 Tax=Mycena maculata TaxID=230809 RepID=A0AAD7HUX7_9AGAR|nr:hypothetical protein DFH07DRAFT_851555 [Mycena maculata]